MELTREVLLEALTEIDKFFLVPLVPTLTQEETQEELLKHLEESVESLSSSDKISPRCRLIISMAGFSLGEEEKEEEFGRAETIEDIIAKPHKPRRKFAEPTRKLDKEFLRRMLVKGVEIEDAIKAIQDRHASTRKKKQARKLFHRLIYLLKREYDIKVTKFYKIESKLNNEKHS